MTQRSFKNGTSAAYPYYEVFTIAPRREVRNRLPLLRYDEISQKGTNGPKSRIILPMPHLTPCRQGLLKSSTQSLAKPLLLGFTFLLRAYTSQQVQFSERQVVRPNREQGLARQRPCSSIHCLPTLLPLLKDTYLYLFTRSSIP